MELASLFTKEKMENAHTHCRSVSAIYIQRLAWDFSLSLDLFSLANTWRSDLGNKQHSAGENPIDTEEKRKKT